MRVITVKQPWAWAIIHGGKDVENRVRNLAGDYRGLVAIHAGKAWDASSYDSPKEWEIKRAITSLENGWPASDVEVWGAETIEPDDARYVRSAIIGVVDLTAVHRGYVGCPHGIEGSPWPELDAYHLCLENPRPLTEPIPWKGALGMRTLPDETTRLVLERAITTKEASDGTN